MSSSSGGGGEASMAAKAHRFVFEDDRLHVSLTDTPLDICSLLSAPAKGFHSQCGALSTFIGTTRNNDPAGRCVVHLEYEAYKSMALRQLQRIAETVFSSFKGVHRVAISHRLGVVRVGEASVIICVSSEHRESGLDAVRWTIEELKAVVPVWKKEVVINGEGKQQTIAASQNSSSPAQQLEGCWKSNRECSERFAASRKRSR